MVNGKCRLAMAMAMVMVMAMVIVMVMVQVVTASERCSDEGNAVAEVVNLGPSDVEYATSANLSVNIPVSGSFILCYRLDHSDVYEQIGTELLTVSASARMLSQVITFASLPACDSYDGPTQDVFEMGFAISAGIHDGTHLSPGNFLYSECSGSRRNPPQVEFQLTVPNAAALQSTQSQLTSLSAASLVDAIAQAAGNYSSGNISANITLPSSGDVQLATPIISSQVVTSHPPTSRSAGAGGATTGSSLQEITLIGGFGLDLRPGQDMAKAVNASESGASCNSSDPAGGSRLITDLGPGDTTGSMSAVMPLQFRVPGQFRLCYRTAGSATFLPVGALSLIVSGVAPTAFTVIGSATLYAGIGVAVLLVGGSGIDRRADGDTLKLVLAAESCADAIASVQV